LQDIIRKFLIFFIPLIFITIFLRFFVYLPEKLKKIETNVKILKKEEATSNVKEEKYIKKSLTVVIDPLNGGKNKGSINDDGISESHLNLEFSFKLAKHLRMLGIRAYLSRFGDKKTSLNDRFKKALKYRPNLYISISCIYIDSDDYNEKIHIKAFSPFKKETLLEAQENSFYAFYEGEYFEKTSDAKFLEERVFNEIKKTFNLKEKNLKRLFLKQSSIRKDIPSLSIFISNFAKDNVRRFAKARNMENLAKKLARGISNGLSLKLK
jgi:N-acetylmuramoyl-L-alanine amidase